MFPKFIHTGSRHHQLLILSMTTFDLSLDSLMSSVHLLHTFTTLPSLYPPKNPLCRHYMDHSLAIHWQELFMEHPLHGIQALQLKDFQMISILLCGHPAANSLQFLGMIFLEYSFWMQLLLGSSIPCIVKTKSLTGDALCSQQIAVF